MTTIFTLGTWPENTRLILADEVARHMYEKTPQDIWDFGTDFPMLRLPFQKVLIEWREPKNLMQADGSVVSMDELTKEYLKQGIFPNFLYDQFVAFSKTAHNRRMAILLVEAGPDERERYEIRAIPFVLDANGKFFEIPPFAWGFQVDVKGQLIPGLEGKKLWIVVDQEKDTSLAKEAAHNCMMFLNVAAMTLSLLNCRNVELVERSTAGKRVKKNDTRPKGSKYYVLGIKPMAKRYTGQGEREGEPGYKVRFHLRRGHFRDYSKGRGLFGKYPGIYWFGPASIGNIELGEIKKDYEVKQ